MLCSSPAALYTVVYQIFLTFPRAKGWGHVDALTLGALPQQYRFSCKQAANNSELL